MGLIRKAVSISTSLGLIGYRSRSEEEARQIRLAAEAAQRQTAGLLQRQNELIEDQTAAIRGQGAPPASAPPARPIPPAPRSAKPDKRDLARFRSEQTAAAAAQLAERERARKLRESDAGDSLRDHLLGPQ